MIRPITDHLPIAIRAFATPKFRDLPDPDKPSKVRKVLGASPWMLIFDTETTTDPGQALRFGSYELRNGEALEEAGLFFDPQGVSPNELEVLRRFADEQGLVLRDRDSFVDDVFFGRAFQLRATIVGFNLPFDISRLAIKHGSARTPLEADNGTMRGAFTFKLSHQKFWPNIRVKHLSSRSALISFAAQMRQRDGRGHRRRGLTVGVRRGHFIDLKTIARAVFARGFSLASLSEFLKIDNPKGQFDNFNGPVTEDMARYAMGDVRATWECYREVCRRIERLGLTATLPEKIYSEASIGKGYLREMGIAPWRKLQPKFPSRMIGTILGTYYGGRSEVRIRREIRQVILCDFLSMYPTVCTLMGLWRFVIATDMTWCDTTEETRAFLENVDLAALQTREAWRGLTTLVRVIPDGDVFPVRAAYKNGVQTTIGLNKLSANEPLWFTLADCIASKLLATKTPTIVEAISFAPGQAQPGLRPVDVGGNTDYRVDPIETDFFKRLIELRQATKTRMKGTTGAEYEALDTEQNALKIAANATSYGIYVESNVERRPRKKLLTVISSTSEPFSFATDLAEMPGTYFHPLLATLITGAARLMLAIAERLITDNELEWTFCDTDSMAIAKPDALTNGEFGLRVDAIVHWFSALNPYDFSGSILKVEGENASLKTSKPEPLYCFAVSAKRYALFNLTPDRVPIMRKVSAHGLGHLLAPYGNADAPSEIPAPHDKVLRDGVERWHCDLWFQIVSAALAGHPDRLRLHCHPALNLPAISRYAATTPELLRWFKSYNRDRGYRDQVKPFGFLLAMRATLDFGTEHIATPRGRGRPRKIIKSKPIAPFDRDLAKAAAQAFDRETGKSVPLSTLQPYTEALAQYHLHPESKFLNGEYFDRGTTQRRHIRVASIRHIGKESNDWERQAMLGLNLDSEVSYGIVTQIASKQ